MAMRHRRLFYIGSLGLLMCLLLAGCQQASSHTPQKLFVGVARYDGSDVFISELTTHFEQALRTAGHKAKVQTLVTTRDAADSARLQNQQVKELLAAGCNVLAVNLVDRTNAGTIIELAKAHDVPVIFFNREPVLADLAQWSKLYPELFMKPDLL
jgi:methyl-galactoside transport system substrate-binding protein